LKQEDAGAILAVRITASKPGFAQEVKTSCARKISGKKVAVTPRAIKLKGSLKIGSTLKVMGRSWGDDVTMQYRWTCDHETLAVTAKPSFTLRPDQAGCRISVTARGYAPGKGSAVSVSNHPEVEKLTMTLPPPRFGALEAGVLVAVESVTAGSTLKAEWPEAAATTAVPVRVATRPAAPPGETHRPRGSS
jgi:hypothetical protein